MGREQTAEPWGTKIIQGIYSEPIKEALIHTRSSVIKFARLMECGVDALLIGVEPGSVGWLEGAGRSHASELHRIPH